MIHILFRNFENANSEPSLLIDMYSDYILLHYLELDPCVPNPCRNAGTCKSHLQTVHSLHFHHGPMFHGRDEHVITVVGPMQNTTIIHPPEYDDVTHENVYVPDEHRHAYAADHYHLTAKEGEQVYEVGRVEV